MYVHKYIYLHICIFIYMYINVYVPVYIYPSLHAPPCAVAARAKGATPQFMTSRAEVEGDGRRVGFRAHALVARPETSTLNLKP